MPWYEILLFRKPWTDRCGRPLQSISGLKNSGPSSFKGGGHEYPPPFNRKQWFQDGVDVLIECDTKPTLDAKWKLKERSDAQAARWLADKGYDQEPGQ